MSAAGTRGVPMEWNASADAHADTAETRCTKFCASPHKAVKALHSASAARQRNSRGNRSRLRYWFRRTPFSYALTSRS